MKNSQVRGVARKVDAETARGFYAEHEQHEGLVLGPNIVFSSGVVLSVEVT